MPQHLVIVACGAAKQTEPAPARELYTGGLFRDALGYAESNCGELKLFDCVRICSAKWGLLKLDQHVAPYDVWLGNVRGGRKLALERTLGNQIGELVAEGGSIDEITVLGGAPYVKLIQSVVRSWVQVKDPLKGLTQGARRHWFKVQREAK